MYNILISDRNIDWAGWEDVRKNSIGSSEICTILGLNQFQSPLDLWCVKTGRKSGQIDNPAMKYGRKVEPIIAELFADKHPEISLTANNSLYQSQEFPFAVCTPDFLTSYNGENFDGVLEIKHTAMYSGWDEGAPDSAHCQLIWQLGILGFKYGYIGAVVGGRAGDLKDPFFEFDQELFSTLIKKAETFLMHVYHDMPPEADFIDHKLVDQIHKKEAGKMIEIQSDQKIQGWLEEYDGACALLKEQNVEAKRLEEIKKKAEANLKMVLADAEIGKLPDGRFVKTKVITMPEKQVKGYSFTRFSISNKL